MSHGPSGKLEQLFDEMLRDAAAWRQRTQAVRAAAAAERAAAEAAARAPGALAARADAIAAVAQAVLPSLGGLGGWFAGGMARLQRDSTVLSAVGTGQRSGREGAGGQRAGSGPAARRRARTHRGKRWRRASAAATRYQLRRLRSYMYYTGRRHAVRALRSSEAESPRRRRVRVYG